MSSLSALCLGGFTLVLLLTAGSQPVDYDVTPTPYYEDDNTSLSFSFFSNTSIEELERFTGRFLDGDEEEEEEEEDDLTVTVAATTATTLRGRVDISNKMSLPVCPEISTLLWLLLAVVSVNLQQLRFTA